MGYEDILNLATSQNWIALAINLILSTIVGGLVILILLAIVTKKTNEKVNLANAFLMVLIINLINIFGIIALMSGFLGSIAILLPIIIWILFMKLFFSEMSWPHILIVGIVGYGLSIFVIPTLVGIVSGYVAF